MKLPAIILFVALIQCSQPKNMETTYVMPLMVKELQELQKNGLLTGEEFEFWINFYDESRYFICPIDAIPFVSTGNNGIHFAFLTDFGENTDLSAAPIICVAPSYDPPVNLVADNLYDFICIITTIENSTLLADQYESQQEFEARKNEWFKGFLSEPIVAEQRNKLADLLIKKFNLKPIKDLVSYTHQIRANRASKMDCESMDGLGIKKVNSEEIVEFGYSKKPEDVMSFLSSANKNSRLLFYRNSYYAYILSNGYDVIIKDIIIQFLEKDGFADEAKNLRLY